MVECELPKLNMRVRFPLPAPTNIPKQTQVSIKASNPRFDIAC